MRCVSRCARANRYVMLACSHSRPPAEGSVSGTIRPKAGLNDTCEDPSRRKQHPRTPPLTTRSAVSRAASASTRPPEDEARTSRRPADHHEPLRDRDGQPQRPPASHNCSASVRAAPLARPRPPEGGPARDDGPIIDHPRSRSTPTACPERRPQAPTARRPRRTANWWTASGANGSTASLHQYKRRT